MELDQQISRKCSGASGWETYPAGTATPAFGDEKPAAGDANPAIGDANPTVTLSNPIVGEANPAATFPNPTAGGANPTVTFTPPMIGFSPRTIWGAPPTIGFSPLFVKNEQFSPKSPAPAARPRRLAPFGAEPAVSQPEPVWTNTAGKITTETNNKTRKDRQIEK